MKTVYFVRHGESEANAGTPLFQGETSPLTEKGKGQAHFIASRASKLTFDVLIASSALRAQQTAQEIAALTRHEIVVEPLFTERILPDGIVGVPRIDPQANELLATWEKGLFDESIQTTGENFNKIKARALKALDFLLQRKEEHLLVVTHGFFLRTMLACVMFGESLTAGEFKKIIKGTRTDNTGLTILTYGAVPQHAVDPNEERWMIRVYNDHAHLG